MNEHGPQEHAFNRGRTSSGLDAWRTPPDVLADLTYLAGWAPWRLDLAAQAHNAVAPTYVGPDHDDPARRDALALCAEELAHLAWNAGAGLAPVWCNPPYDTWGGYARLLAEAAGYGVRSCLLVFGRSDTVAWHDAAPRALAIAQRKGRVRFLLPDGTPGGTAPAPSVALFFGQRPAAPVYRGAVRAPSGSGWLVVRP